ncbi:ribonuclease HII [Patescibacteria group bacterium]
MKQPHTLEEGRLRKKGCTLIAGSDEAGRGAWAGPLVAAAVILPSRHSIHGIKDSKQLSPSTREKLYVEIISQAKAWAVYSVLPRTIDRHGISYANKKAISQAIRKLAITPHALLIDAFAIPSSVPMRAIIKGDEKVQSIAAASIIAKVTRDRLMVSYHRRFPLYGFHIHKGYGTHSHQLSLQKHGACPLHRRSFKPIKNMVEKV